MFYGWRKYSVLRNKTFRIWSQFGYQSAEDSVVEAGVTFWNIQMNTIVHNLESVWVSIIWRQCYRGWIHFLEASDVHICTESGVIFFINQQDKLL